MPRVNGQLAVSRAFGDKSLKSHLRSDPDVQSTDIDADTGILILASDGLWKVKQNCIVVFMVLAFKDYHKKQKEKKFPLHVVNQVMANQEAVDIARRMRDPQKAAKQLTAEAIKRDSKDDISCVVVKFR